MALGLDKKLKKINPMDDDLFGSNLNEQIENIPVEKLKHYSKHTFTLYSGARKQDLVKSIKENGILMPIIVTPDVNVNGDYMILAGHNRFECGKEAGLTDIPSRIKYNLSQDEERQIVIETNLFQRGFSELSISERASIISDYYELMRKQGKNTNDIETELQKISDNEDLSPVGTRQVAQEYSLSKNSIARLIRINSIIDELKQKVDENELSIRAAVDLSYLTEDIQKDVNSIIDDYNIKLDMKKSQYLKNERFNGLSIEKIKAILVDNKKINEGDKKKKVIKVQKNIIEKYFYDETEEEIQDIIEKALEMYFIENDI